MCTMIFVIKKISESGATIKSEIFSFSIATEEPNFPTNLWRDYGS